MYCSYFVVYWCLFCLYSHAEILFMIKVSLLTVSHGRSRTSLSRTLRGRLNTGQRKPMKSCTALYAKSRWRFC